MSVSFNSIAPGIVAPIFAFEVNSGGQFESESRILLVGHKTTAGTMAADAPVYAASQEAVDQLAGSHSILRDMYRRARANAPAAEIWIAAAPATGTAAQWTLTVGTIPAAGGVGTLRIAGEPIVLSVAAGATSAQVATDLAAAISGYFDGLTRATLPFASATSASAVVTLTAAHAGEIFADLDLWIDTTVAGNLFTASNLTIAASVAGSGTPNLAAVLAALADDPFDTIVSPFADATNLGRYAATLSDTAGRWAWSRQVYGHAWTVKTDTAANLVTAGLALTDDRHLTMLARIASSGDATPAWGWLAAYAARQAVWLHDGANGGVSRNMTGLALELVAPPRDRSKWPAYDNRDAFLRSRLSTWRVESGRVVVDKAVTAYKYNALGQPDTVFRDVQALYQLMYALRFFRARLAYEHGQKALADENPLGAGSISTPSDIKATFVHAYEALVMRGVLENADGFAAGLVVARNADNADRVDVKAPLDRVNPLDVIAANATLYAQF